MALLLAACGCSGAIEPPLVSPGEVTPDMVTGAAAAALGADGRFTIEPPAIAPGGVPRDTAVAQAIEFAAYVTNNVLLRGVVEAGRGGYWTDPHLLSPCDRPPAYVHPQLGALDVDSLPPVGRDLFQRKFGGSWLVALCGTDGLPQMTVQVAVHGNALRFEDGAPRSPDPNLLAAFSPSGVPLNWPDALPVSAERAVRHVWDQFRVRIAGVPELLARGDVNPAGEYVLQSGSGRTCSRWRIVLEGPVAVKSGTTQDVRTTNELYVSALTCSLADVVPVLQIPVPGQATDAAVSYTDFGAVPPRVHRIVAAVTSPVRFDIAIPVPRF